MQPRTARSIALGLSGLVLSGLAVAGCSSWLGPAGPTPDLAGTRWSLVRLAGSPPLEGSHVSLRFDEDQLGGVAGCNAYGGAYRASGGGELSVADLASTDMACPSPAGVLDQESAYLRSLQAATAYRVDDGRLHIEVADAPGPLVFAPLPDSRGDPATLVGTAWRLRTLDGRTLEQRYTMGFPDEGTAFGRAVCRVYVSGYLADEDRLAFTSTSMAGPFCPELAEAESAFTDALTWVSSFDIADDRFELRTDRGETLVFEPLDAAPAPAGEWRLVAFVAPNSVAAGPVPVLLTEEPLPGSSITLRFDGDRLEGHAGCNRYGGSLEREGRRIDIVRLSITEKACLEPSGVMQQETRYVRRLDGVTRYLVAGDVLWLGGPGSRALIFERTDGA